MEYFCHLLETEGEANDRRMAKLRVSFHFIVVILFETEVMFKERARCREKKKEKEEEKEKKDPVDLNF